MNFMGKALTIMTGTGLGGIGVLFVMWVLSWNQNSVYDAGWLFLLLPIAGMLVLSGAYIVYRGVTAQPPYISPTGTGETGPSN